MCQVGAEENRSLETQGRELVPWMAGARKTSVAGSTLKLQAEEWMGLSDLTWSRVTEGEMGKGAQIQNSAHPPRGAMGANQSLYHFPCTNQLPDPENGIILEHQYIFLS